MDEGNYRWTGHNDDEPPWSEARARSLVGKRIIIGITRLDADGNPLGQEQLHGEVVGVNAKDGVAIRIAGRADLYWLPPHLGAFHSAPPGEYRFRATGEVVVDPDLMSTWTVHAPRVH